MELSQDVKNNLIKQKLSELKVKEYQISLDIVVLNAVGDEEGVAALEARIANIQTAYKAVEGELKSADTESSSSGGQSESEANP